MKKLTKSKQPHTSIMNSTFNGVQWDAKAVDAIGKIADGLIENAKGLSALAQVLKSSNVNIEALVRIGENK